MLKHVLKLRFLEHAMDREKQRSAWREQLAKDFDGLYSVYLPMQKGLRSKKEVEEVFREYGDIKTIKQTANLFFVKYKDPECALAAITAHHDKHQANVGVTKITPVKPNPLKPTVKINFEKQRLEEDVRGLYTICVKKDKFSKAEIMVRFAKYGAIFDPSDTDTHVYIRYRTRKSAEDAIENETGRVDVHVPAIYFKYRKKPGSPENPLLPSPPATNTSNGSHGTSSTNGTQKNRDTKAIPSLLDKPMLPSSPEKPGDLPPPPAAFSDLGGGDEGARGVTLDMIRACVQEQIQLQTDTSEYRGSTTSSDYVDAGTLCEFFPVHYSFLGLATDISRSCRAGDILCVMLRPIADSALSRLRALAHARFPRARAFTQGGYDLSLEGCLGGEGGGGMASLAQLHAFMQQKNKELSGDPELLHSVHAMNRAVLKLCNSPHPEPYITVNLWRQWLHALHMAVIECGRESCLGYTCLGGSGEMVTGRAEPSFAVYSCRPPTHTDMHALVDLDREPMLIIDLFPSQSSSSSSSGSLPHNDPPMTQGRVLFSDFLDLPASTAHPPVAFTVPNVWRNHLVVHLQHLLSVVQSKHSRSGGSGGGDSKYEAFGLLVLHRRDVYVTRLSAPAPYLLALRDRRPQNRPTTGPQASLSLSRWKLDFALPNHRQALAEFIAVLDSSG